jgi:DNA-binding transcriptional ArsR family regulator
VSGGGSEPTDGATDVLDVRIAKAKAHPLRAEILAQLHGDEASPRELASRLDAPLSTVAYHVRVLVSLDLVHLVSQQPRRGSVEHFYRAVPD